MAIKTYGTMAVDWERRIDFDRLRRERLARIKDLLAKSEMGSVLCFDMNNVRYITATHIGTWAQDKISRFTLLPQDDAVEVTLSWQGGSRAMLIQLYRAGAGLVHEDLAPRDGAPTITFRRVGLEPMEYELRVVNMETNATHPFTLTLTTWE